MTTSSSASSSSAGSSDAPSSGARPSDARTSAAAKPAPKAQSRVRAARLEGRGWLNTGGARLDLDSLKGKIVVLDFWTFCCINCLHVLDELRPLEAKYGDAVVVIGVHSPKFEHERDPQALAAAVERYGVEHPVLDDPDLRTWDAYAARAWPTLVVLDPEGYVVSTMAGEGHAEALDRIIGGLVETHTAKGTLDPEGSPYVAAAPAETALRFPGKAIALPGGDVLVSDSARHRLVRLAPDLSTVKTVIGTGVRGRADGPAPEFNEPQGLLLLPEDVAAAVGYDLVVADTVNHLLRGVDLASGTATTVAGTGRQWRMDTGSDAALDADLSSPWDLAWYDGKVVVAMAGIHQLWAFDPAARTVGAYAGTTVESLKDGPLDQVWMAQPSASPSAPGRTAASACGSPTPRPPRSGTSRTARCAPSSARACSTSGTWMAPPQTRSCSTPSASPSSPTAASPSPTPTTGPCAPTTRAPARSRPSRPGSPNPATSSPWGTGWSSSSPPRTASPSPTSARPPSPAATTASPASARGSRPAGSASTCSSRPPRGRSSTTRTGRPSR
nr:hypothetical protein GCM10025732_09790 [Glycomyces mayteni]